MIDASYFAAWIQVALAAQPRAEALVQRARRSIDIVENARAQRVLGELELDGAARRHTDTVRRVIIMDTNDAPRYPRVLSADGLDQSRVGYSYCEAS